MGLRLTRRQAEELTNGQPLVRSEAEVQSAILAYLRTVPGVYAFRCNSRVVKLPGKGGRDRLVRFGVKGLPDILGWQMEPGPRARFLAIEVKRPGRAPTPEQGAFLDLLRRMGGIALVATSVEDVAAALCRADG